MKEYIELYRATHHNGYYPIYTKFPSVWHLNDFLEDDYRSYDQEMFIRTINHYNSHFVFNDFNNKVMYIGLSDWETDSNITSPQDEEFSDYVNEDNSCKISVENFKAFIIEWKKLKKDLPAFALIYRDDSDWIECKGFDSQEEMEAFIRNVHREVIH